MCNVPAMALSLVLTAIRAVMFVIDAWLASFDKAGPAPHYDVLS